MSALSLVVVRTDEGCEVQSVHESREEARLARHSARHVVVDLDADALRALAAAGVVLDADGSDADGGSVDSSYILPDVWS